MDDVSGADREKFSAEEWFNVPRAGWVAIVRSGIERDRQNAGLIGQDVDIDGKVYRCVGLDTWALGTPITANERIGLLISGEP